MYSAYLLFNGKAEILNYESLVYKEATITSQNHQKTLS